jgi:hypothetical protein
LSGVANLKELFECARDRKTRIEIKAMHPIGYVRINEADAERVRSLRTARQRFRRHAGRFGIRYRSSSFSKASAMCVPDWWA